MKTVKVVTVINAPVDIVWTELCAVSTYADWNPYITSFEGDLAVGSRPLLRLAPPNGSVTTFRPTITQVDADRRRLEWVGRMGPPGVLDARHSIQLDAIPGGRTRMNHAEQFSGLMVTLSGRSVLDRARSGFEVMNEALRLRVEAIAPAAVR